MEDQEIIDTLRRTYEAFSRADFDTAIEMAHPDIEYHAPGGQSVRRGADALRAWMEPDAFEEQQIEPLEFRVHGDKVWVRQHNGPEERAAVSSWTTWAGPSGRSPTTAC